MSIADKVRELESEVKVKNYEMEQLKKENAELKSLVLALLSKNTDKVKDEYIDVSEDLFYDLCNQYNHDNFGEQEEFYEQEYTISWNGIGTTTGMSPALYDYIERYCDEYL